MLQLLLVGSDWQCLVVTQQLLSCQLLSSQLFSSQLPSSQLPSSQLPSSQLPGSRLPSSQLPSSQLPSRELSYLSPFAQPMRLKDFSVLFFILTRFLIDNLVLARNLDIIWTHSANQEKYCDTHVLVTHVLICTASPTPTPLIIHNWIQLFLAPKRIKHTSLFEQKKTAQK